MKTVTLQGEKLTLFGHLPQNGTKAIDFQLTATDLSVKSLSDFKGKRLVLNIFPSIDTEVCANSVRYFNEKASQMPNTTVLCVSRDLPFAHGRFCSANNLENVIPLSDYKQGQFGKDYGVFINDHALAGLLTRAIVLLDSSHHVGYTQLEPEITSDPDFDAALKQLKELK